MNDVIVHDNPFGQIFQNGYIDTTQVSNSTFSFSEIVFERNGKGCHFETSLRGLETPPFKTLLNILP